MSVNLLGTNHNNVVNAITENAILGKPIKAMRAAKLFIPNVKYPLNLSLLATFVNVEFSPCILVKEFTKNVCETVHNAKIVA